MNSENASDQVVTEDFPQSAKDVLQAFYRGRGVSDGTTRQKIEAFKQLDLFKDAVIAADDGFADEAEELRTIEFVYLTKNRLI